MDYEKKDIDQKVTDENVKLAGLLEETAKFINDTGAQIVNRLNKISDHMFQLKPQDAELVFNTGILIGKMDQVAVTMHAYLESYLKFQAVYLTSINSAKEEMH